MDRWRAVRTEAGIGRLDDDAVITRRKFASALAAMTAGTAFGGGMLRAERPPLRIAVSMDTLAGVNVTDARAAYRVWGEEIAKILLLRHTELLNQVFVPSAQLTQMIRSRQVDCFALTALEYAAVVDWIDPTCSIIENDELNGMDYLLLVRNDSPYRKIADLRGSTLLLLRHRHTSLLRVWIDLELARAGCPDLNRFFAMPETRDQIAEVILPVFFGRAQAAGISRQDFAMAVELNPQLGRELRVLADSPRIIPDGFWFRKDCDPVDRDDFLRAMVRLSTIPQGRQVLAVYQCTGFQQRPNSIMNGTVEMIHQYERLCTRAGR